jgi:putative ubiquitin-RnfH superfamily antitoxin RatB of RatAB toxin-antitoxin module
MAEENMAGKQDHDITVEVVYAQPDKQLLLTLQVPVGTTLMEAIEASEIRSAFPGMEVDVDRLGVFGQRAAADQELREGDRVEIYRPLIADPKEVRRARALDKQASNKQALNKKAGNDQT